MVLHTDQGHPHVHLVVKAEHEYEPGKRLHISKPMLRHWREEFAACLREQGVAANASTAWTRGRARTGKKDPIHHRLRAMRDFATPPESAKRGVSPPKASTFMRRKVTAVAAELRSGSLQVDPAKQALLEGRRVLEEDWASVAAALREQGEADLAHQVEGFVQALPEVRTEKESIAAGLLAEINAQRRSHSNPSGDRGGQEPGQLK
jgi:hypothetical protein